MPDKNRKAKYTQKPTACHQESQAIEEHLLQLGAAQFLESIENRCGKDPCAIFCAKAEMLEGQK